MLTMFDDGAFDAAAPSSTTSSSLRDDPGGHAAAAGALRRRGRADDAEAAEDDDSAYEFEPSEDVILAELLPRNMVCRCSRPCWKTPRPNRARG